MNKNIIISLLVFFIIISIILYYLQQNPEKLESIPFSYYELNELVISTVLFIIILIVIRLKLIDNNISNNTIISYITILAPCYFVFYLLSKLTINMINSDNPIHNSNELILYKNI
jgi:hypothetical protein